LAFAAVTIGAVLLARPDDSRPRQTAEDAA